MTDKKVYDQYGTEIAIGDLVVTHGKVGMVAKFNAHGSVNVRIRSTKNVYAYEWGAPKIERKGTRYKRDEQGYYVKDSNGRNTWEQEEYTYFDKDYRVVGEEPYTYTVIRQNTQSLTVLRKVDGILPSPFLEAIEKHKIIFPNKEQTNG